MTKKEIRLQVRALVESTLDKKFGPILTEFGSRADRLIGNWNLAEFIDVHRDLLNSHYEGDLKSTVTREGLTGVYGTFKLTPSGEVSPATMNALYNEMKRVGAYTEGKAGMPVWANNTITTCFSSVVAYGAFYASDNHPEILEQFKNIRVTNTGQIPANLRGKVPTYQAPVEENILKEEAGDMTVAETIKTLAGILKGLSFLDGVYIELDRRGSGDRINYGNASAYAEVHAKTDGEYIEILMFNSNEGDLTQQTEEIKTKAEAMGLEVDKSTSGETPKKQDFGSLFATKLALKHK